MDLILETERLIFRPLEISDAEALFELNKNPNVHKYLWQKPEKEIEEIIADHKEMISNAIDEGLSEEEIKAKFGKPSQVAEELADSDDQEPAEQEETKGFQLPDSIDDYAEAMKEFAIGDLIGIIPVHSCLTANLMANYLSIDDEIIDQ